MGKNARLGERERGYLALLKELPSVMSPDYLVTRIHALFSVKVPQAGGICSASQDKGMRPFFFNINLGLSWFINWRGTRIMLLLYACIYRFSGGSMSACISYARN